MRGPKGNNLVSPHLMNIHKGLIYDLFVYFYFSCYFPPTLYQSDGMFPEEGDFAFLFFIWKHTVYVTIAMRTVSEEGTSFATIFHIIQFKT